jgi:hypothetical protein
MMLPNSGDILVIDRDASVQFLKPMRFRVIRILKRETYEGWLWLEGYEVNQHGDAVERRQIFVQARGLRMAIPIQPAVPRARPMNTRPVAASPPAARRAMPAPRTPQRNTAAHL